MTDTFLKDVITDRLKDDVPEVVSATLKVVKVCERVNTFPFRPVAVLLIVCIDIFSVAV